MKKTALKLKANFEITKLTYFLCLLQRIPTTSRLLGIFSCICCNRLAPENALQPVK